MEINGQGLHNYNKYLRQIFIVVTCKIELCHFYHKYVIQLIGSSMTKHTFTIRSNCNDKIVIVIIIK